MAEGGPRRPPRLLLVTGMSGAGKSTVLDALEDMGWDVVDNLPADLIEQFVHKAVMAAIAEHESRYHHQRRGPAGSEAEDRLS